MLPPMMPLLDDALWLGLSAGLALLAWRMAARLGLRLALSNLRRPLAQAATTPASWFEVKTQETGNSAFDEWRDKELDRIEAEREALEVRLTAFRAFVETLKRAKDRETFERFMAQFRGGVEADEGVAVRRPG